MTRWRWFRCHGWGRSRWSCIGFIFGGILQRSRRDAWQLTEAQ